MSVLIEGMKKPAKCEDCPLVEVQSRRERAEIMNDVMDAWISREE